MATDMENFEKLRPVGLLEKYSTARHPLGFYLNVGLAATYTIPETFTLPLKDYIYNAIETLINQHPILSAIPLGEDTGDPYFVRLPEVDLAQPISFRKRAQTFPAAGEPDSELESVLQSQHNIGFTAPSPFWRLLILTDDADGKRFTAVFVYHHAIGDGTSGKAFHRTFLQALRGSASLTAREAKQVVASPKTPLLPNLETVNPLPLSLPYILKVLFKEKIYCKPDTKLWAAGAFQNPTRTQLRITVLTAAQTLALAKVCREHGTTVTCAIQTAVARAIFPHIPENYVRVMCSGAMSSRSWLTKTITDDAIGVWVQEFSEFYTRKTVTQKPFPWNEAKRSRQTILKEVNLKSKNTSVGLFKYVKNYRDDLLVSKIGKPRVSTYEVSSLGVVKTENSKDPTIPQMGRVIFSQSSSVTGSAIEVSVITGADECLALGISWQAGVVEDNVMQGVIDMLSKELRQLSE